MPLGKDISVEARDESSRTLTLTAATVLIAEVGIQGCLAPDHLREVPYMGLSFIAVGPLLTVVLIGVLTAPRAAWTWRIGTAVCAAMGLAFTASRTVGRPGLHESWTSDSGVGLPSLVLELVFAYCAVRNMKAARTPRPRHIPSGGAAFVPGSDIDTR